MLDDCYDGVVRRLRIIGLTTWLTAGVLVLLPVLAVMQYRWLSRIGDDAESRMRVVAENAARALSSDLGFELLRAWRSRVSEPGSGVETTDVDTSLILDALVIDHPEGATEVRLRRWDLDARTCAQAAWPDDLASLRPEANDHLAGTSEREAWNLVASLQRAGAALGVLPLTLSGGAERLAASRSPCAAIPPAIVLVRFDQDRVRERLLSELFRRHLEGLLGEFRFAIVDRAQDSATVYAPTGTDIGELLAAPDLAVPIVLGRDGAPGAGRDGHRGLPPVAYFERGRGGEGGHHGRGSEGWSVVGRHRAGSLDAAVSRLRNRNLVVSLGILLLMGVAVAMIAANARRTEELGRQQVEFVASVSHEMRTPVSAIDVAARNLEDGVVTDPARVRKYGGLIRTEARRLAETVERVLQLAALDAGRGVGERAPVDVRTTLDEVVTRARHEHPEAVIEFAHDGRDATVTADADVLRSCVQNLVGNALKYRGHACVGATRPGAGLRSACRDAPDRRGPRPRHRPSRPPARVRAILPGSSRHRPPVARQWVGPAHRQAQHGGNGRTRGDHGDCPHRVHLRTVPRGSG